MSESLAGGLVPLGKRPGSGSTGSKTLSGGLIPLAGAGRSKAHPSANEMSPSSPFRRLESERDAGNNDSPDNDGGSHWDKDDGGSGGMVAAESVVSKMKKKRASAGRRGDVGRKKHGRSTRTVHEEDDSAPGTPTRHTKQRGLGESRDHQHSAFPAEADDDGNDDHYLFTGATAGAKGGGRKNGGGVAEATALLLGGSDDSFSFTAASGMGRTNPGSTDKPSARDRPYSGELPHTVTAGTSPKSDARSADNSHYGGDGGLLPLTGSRWRDPSSSVTEVGANVSRLSGTSTRDSSSFVEASSTLGVAPSSVAAGSDVDDENSFDEADVLLRMTDPEALAGKISTTSGAALPPSTGANTRQDGSRRSRFRALSSPTVDTNGGGAFGGVAGRDEVSEGSAVSGSRWRSPSPPPRARRGGAESPEMSPRRMLAEHGPLNDLHGSGAADISAVEAAERMGRGRDPAAVRLGGDACDKTSSNTFISDGDPGFIGKRKTGPGVAARHDETASFFQKHEPSPLSRPNLSDNGGAMEPTAGGVAPVTKGIPRRSALVESNKPRDGRAKSRGVTFDDDLDNVDALDILPGSDDDTPSPPPAAAVAAIVDRTPTFSLDNKEAVPPSSVAPLTTALVIPSVLVATSAEDTSSQRIGENSARERSNSDEGIGRFPTPASESSTSISTKTCVNRSAQRSRKSLTAGLSRAAAALMAESSSSGEEEAQNLVSSNNVDVDSLLGPGKTTVMLRGKAGVDRANIAPAIADDMEYDVKLDLALGFTPSAMDGRRRQRKSLPAGGRRRSRAVETPPQKDHHPVLPIPKLVNLAPAPTAAVASTTATSEEPTMGSMPPLAYALGTGTQTAKSTTDRSDGGSDVRTYQGMSGIPSIGGTSTTGHDLREATTGSPKDGALSGSGSVSSGGSKDKIDCGHDGTNKNSSSSSSGGTVEVSMLSSLERQLALLTSDREAVAARFEREEERRERARKEAQAAAAAAEVRAREGDSALAAARARIRQLEAESVGHRSALAALEAKAAADLRAEQASSLQKISDAETRHQDGVRESERRNEEALTQLKRLHREELEDVKRRNADSQTLETLAGQVQASAGALKLLHVQMLDRKGASEVSREGQLEARERLIQELEGSAKRSQQLAEDEVQRLQGTLMAMDQVMRGLRGQNAGERERLRQEHLRLEEFQGSMVAEVEARRHGVDEERKRLAERFAMLDKDKRGADAANREESERLAELRVQLDTEREKFAAMQVSASQAVEATARRQAEQEKRLNLARQSLEKEAMSLEARLTAARADLRKAEEVRATSDRMRDQDEVDRGRLKSMAAELERAFEEVGIRGAEIEEKRRELENARTQAIESFNEARKEKESLRLRSAQVDEAARRQDEERTNIARARAQSATELSTSRRLKSELARAVANHQNRLQQRSNQQTIHLSVESSAPFLAARRGWHNSVALENENTADKSFDALRKAGEHGTRQSPTGNGEYTGIQGPIPHTGIVAAQATLQAGALSPSFLGLDVARELARLAQRAAEMRECTREQSAFLLHARAKTTPYLFDWGTSLKSSLLNARSASIPVARGFQPVQQQDQSLLHTLGGIGDKLDVNKLLAMPSFKSSTTTDLRGDSAAVGGRWMEGLRPTGVEECVVKGLGCRSAIGLSRNVMEDIEEIERACSKRTSALQEDAAFVETLGHVESPAVAM